MTRLYHKTITDVSIGGRQYSADADGIIEVPEDAADQLVRCFGLIDIGSGPPPAETGPIIAIKLFVVTSFRSFRLRFSFHSPPPAARYTLLVSFGYARLTRLGVLFV
jgi:hypothetical protein